MIKLVPEMQLAAGLARNTMPRAASSAEPIRPEGIQPQRHFEEIRIAFLDIAPDAAFEISIAW